MAPSGRCIVPPLQSNRRINTAGKKRHTVQNTRIADVEQRLVRSLSETYPGRIHDKRICDLEAPVLPPEITLFQDTGFQGYHPPGVTIYPPKKKPTGDELTAAEKADNNLISSMRIVVEHLISGVKRCRIVKDVFRNTKEFFADQVREIACGLHNFRTTFRQHALE